MANPMEKLALFGLGGTLISKGRDMRDSAKLYNTMATQLDPVDLTQEEKNILLKEQQRYNRKGMANIIGGSLLSGLGAAAGTALAWKRKDPGLLVIPGASAVLDAGKATDDAYDKGYSPYVTEVKSRLENQGIRNYIYGEDNDKTELLQTMSDIMDEKHKRELARGNRPLTQADQIVDNLANDARATYYYTKRNIHDEHKHILKDPRLKGYYGPVALF